MGIIETESAIASVVSPFFQVSDLSRMADDNRFAVALYMPWNATRPGAGMIARLTAVSLATTDLPVVPMCRTRFRL
jgi:hypothetical protein